MNEYFYEDQEGKTFEDLIRSFEEGLAIEEVPFYDSAIFELIIDHYERKNRFEDALTVARIGSEQHPFSSTFYMKQSNLLVELKEYEQALTLLEKAEILDSTDIEIYFLKADIYCCQKKYELAIDILQYALSICDDMEMEELYIEMAEVYEQAEQFHDAYECLKAALDLNPNSEVALNRIWFCIDLTQEYEDSIELYKGLIDEDPYNYLAWYNLGHSYMGMGLYEKAVEAYEFTLAINEEYDLAYRECADAHYELANYESAVYYYKEHIKLTKPYKKIYYQVGCCYEKLNDRVKARYYFRLAIKKDPRYSEAYYRMGLTLREDHKYQEALLRFQKALQIEPANVEYINATAEILTIMGDYESAIQMLDEGVRTDADNLSAWISLSRLYFEQDEIDKAVNIVEEAMKYCGSEGGLNFLKSAYLIGSGMRKEGLFELEKALDEDNTYYKILFDIIPSLQNDPVVLNLIGQYI